MSVLKSWWDVVKATGNVMRITLRLFRRDPLRMLYATSLSLFGDKEEAGRQIKKIEGQG